jgi:nucleotide-binding universal stress UspA family protein
MPVSPQRADAAVAQRYGAAVEVRSIAASSARRALHELAEREHVDLIVVGSTGRSRLGRTLPGTTADRLLHGAGCPVAVAPRGYAHKQSPALQRIGAAFCADPDDLGRAYGPFGRVLLGSISHAVMLACPAPVLVVPRPVATRHSRDRRADHDRAVTV